MASQATLTPLIPFKAQLGHCHPPHQSQRIILCFSWIASLTRCSTRFRMRSKSTARQAPKQWSACMCSVRRWM